MSLIVNNSYPLEKSGKTVVFSFRIDESIYELVKNIATTESRSINSTLSILLDNAIIDYLEENDNSHQ